MNFPADMTHQGHTFRSALSAVLLVLVLSSCNSAQSRARTAYAQYQVALASNDVFAARRALIKLVTAQDDVAENWLELGKLDAREGRYGDAYYAFTRARELDRSNPEILRVLTEIALRGGNLAAAQLSARDLDVVAPGNPWVKIVDGYVALSQNHFDEALLISNALLAVSPYDPNATVLKARSLLGSGGGTEAQKLLEAHVRVQSADLGSWNLLTQIYQRSKDWSKVAMAAGHLVQLDRSNRNPGLLLIEAALRSGDVMAARRESSRLLQPSTNPTIISAVLDRWADYWPSDQRVDEARKLAKSANPVQKIVYAAFLNRINRPSEALALAAPYADLPIKAANVEANAVVADGLARGNKASDAKSRLDAVLAYDSGNATALRSRAEFLLRNGQANLAVADAQKLVTVVPQSPRDRILLWRCFAANGDPKQAARTLWNAFHDIEANEPIFLAIEHANAGQPEVVTQIKEEYAAQLDKALNRGLL